MSILVSCPCGKAYPVKEQYAGKRLQCPGCKRTLTVPGGSSLPPAGPPRAAVSSRISKRSPTHRPNNAGVVDPPVVPSSGNLVLILGVVFVLLLGGGGAALYFLLRDTGPGKDDRTAASEVDGKKGDDKAPDDRKKADSTDPEEKGPEKKEPDKHAPPPKESDPKPRVDTPPDMAGAWQGHNARILGVGFARDGRVAMTASGGEVLRDGMKVPATDSTVRLWDPATGKELQRLDGFPHGLSAVAFDPNAALVAVADAQADAFDLHLWSLADKRELRALRGHTAAVICAAFTSDGRRLLSGGRDGRLRVWDVEAGTQTGEFPHPGYVNDVAVSTDGRLAVTACADRVVRVIDLAKKTVKELPPHQDIVWAVAISPDGKHAASAGGGDYDATLGRFVPGARDFEVRLWDVGTGQEVRRFRGHTDNVRAIAFSPDGRRLLSAGYDRSVRLWHVLSGRELSVFDKHTDWVQCVAFFPDGRRALSGGYDKTLQVYTLPPEPGDLVKKLQDPGADKVETMRELARYGAEAKDAVPILLQFLGDSDPGVKRTALDTLTRVGTVGKESVAQLVPLVKDTAFPEGQRFALDVLASLGADAKPALPAVVGLLARGTDVATRLKVIRIVAAIGADARETAYTPLLELLRDTDAEVARAAGDALSKLGKPTRAELPTLERFLTAPSEPVRRYALLAIADMGEEARGTLAPLLTSLEGDKSADCRMLALAALLKTQKETKGILNPLNGALADTEPKVRAAAAAALVALPADLATLLKMQEHSDPAVQKIAETALDKYSFGPPDVKAINDGLQSKREAVRGRMLKAAAKLGPDAAGAVPGLIDVVKTTTGETREAAIDVLANLGPAAKAAGPALVPLLKDGDRKSKLAICLVLSKIHADEAAQALPFLVALLKVTDLNDEAAKADRKTAHERLVEIGAPAVDELLKALTGDFAGGNPNLPIGAINAYARLEALQTLTEIAKNSKEPLRKALLPLSKIENSELIPEVKAAARQARLEMQKPK